MSMLRTFSRLAISRPTAQAHTTFRTNTYCITKSPYQTCRYQQLLQQQRRYGSSRHKLVEDEAPAPPRAKRSRTIIGNSRWTTEIDEMIVDLRKNNRTWEYIALATGRSNTACSDRFYTVLDPTLQEWTPAMITRLNQMVEEGRSWREISIALGRRSITCQHQWRTLGNGTNLAQGLLWTGTRLKWSTTEIDRFWRAWLDNNGQDWAEIARAVRTRGVKECREHLKALVLNAVNEAPGWVKVESVNYVSETNRIARSHVRAQLNEKAILGKLKVPPSGKKAWTEDERASLLNAVEKHGLFSAWDTIRDEVKPALSKDEVQAEYYRLTGMSDEEDTKDQQVEVEGKNNFGKSSKAALEAIQDFEWSEQDVDQLNAILSRYSHLQIWKDEAKASGIDRDSSTSASEFSDLFTKKSEDHDDNNESGVEGEEKSILGNDSKKDDENPNPESDSELWTKLRVARLKRLVKQQQRQKKQLGGAVNWSWVAEHIGPGFDENMCISQWHSLPSKGNGTPNSEPKAWDVRDINALREGIKIYGKAWVSIQKHFLPDRTTDSIRRKVTNSMAKRNNLIEEANEKARQMKLSNENVNHAEVVKLILEENPVWALAKELDLMYESFRKSGIKVKSACGRPRKNKEKVTE